MTEKTLGQVAFEALKSASADTLGHGLTWEAAPDWVREKWEKIGQAVAKKVLSSTMVDDVKGIGAAEERERLAMVHDEKSGKLAREKTECMWDIEAYRHDYEAKWLRAGGKP